MEQTECECGTAPKLIFPCSGGSDVGELADRAARQLTQKGAGKMYCLAGIGGKVSGIIKSAEAAQSLLVIDGCPIDCAKKTLEVSGFKDFQYFRVTDLGMTKGNAPVTEDNLQTVVAKGESLLKGQSQSPSIEASSPNKSSQSCCCC